MADSDRVLSEAELISMSFTYTHTVASMDLTR